MTMPPCPRTACPENSVSTTQPSKDLLVYLNFSEGYKAGGFPGDIAFLPYPAGPARECLLALVLVGNTLRV